MKALVLTMKIGVGLGLLILLTACGKSPIADLSCNPACTNGFECVSGTCKKPCTDNLDCSATATCEDGYCIPECSPSQPCSGDTACVMGFCLSDCESFKDCAPDQTCEAYVCVGVDNAQCHANDDCSALGSDYECWEGRCQKACTDFFDCMPDEVCENLLCVGATDGDCEDNDDCSSVGAGYLCYGATCYAPCNDFFDCDPNQECTNGICLDITSPTCDDNADCASLGTGYECWGGECRKPCVSFFDCEKDEACDSHGFCLPVDDPACDEDNDCTSYGSDYVCWEGRCRNDLCVGSDGCVIGAVCYVDGTVNTNNPCQVCDVDANSEDWSAIPDGQFCDAKELHTCLSGVDTNPTQCPFGCFEDSGSAAHCVEPSNWGYWDGSSQVQEGVTLAWINGVSKALDYECLSGTLILDTNTDTASLLVVCEGTTFNMDGNYKVIPQRDFHSLGVPGVTDINVVPDLVAARFDEFTVGNNVTVECRGNYPLAIAVAEDATIGGTWNIRCGSMPESFQDGKGGDAITDSNRYDIRGGAGAGYGSAGGSTGDGPKTINAGQTYGNTTIQPLIGGSKGGLGFGNKQLDTSALPGAGTSAPDQCWFAWDGSSQGCPDIGAYSMTQWISEVWDVQPSNEDLKAPGGSGGGALQFSVLGTLTILTGTEMNAIGQGGRSMKDCSKRTSDNCSLGVDCDLNGKQIHDSMNYPIMTNVSGAVCGGTACSDIPDASVDHPWDLYMLQTAGGGGSGGAILFEGSSVVINPNARISSEGGGGGAGCYIYAKAWGFNDGGIPVFNAFSCSAESYIAAGDNTGECVETNTTNSIPIQCWGSSPATSQSGGGYVFTNNQGGAGGNDTNLQGQNASYGTLVDGSFDCIGGTGYNDDVNFPQNNVSWGGGGGGAGMIRFNTPGGNGVKCEGCNFDDVLVPNPSTNVVTIDGAFATSGANRN